jgi:hypothetical protein
MIRSWLQAGLCGLALCGALATGQIGAQGDSGSDAPYIYYYSSEHDAFVIERADGTDTHLLGEGTSGGVDGPGWSPSGKWFAWTTSNYIINGYIDSQRAHAISTDGTRHLTWLDDKEFSRVQMIWARDTDLLFVAGQTIEWNEDPARTDGNIVRRTIAIIDVPAGQVLAEYTSSGSYTDNDLWLIPLSPVLFQLASGNIFVAQYYDYGGNYSPGAMTLYQLDTSGDVAVQRLEHIYVSNIPDYQAPSFTYSPQGWITYAPFAERADSGRGSIVLEHIPSGETIALDGCGTYAEWQDASQLRISGEKLCRFDVNTMQLDIVKGFAHDGKFGTLTPDRLRYVEFDADGTWDLLVYDLRADPPTMTQIPAPDVEFPERVDIVSGYSWSWGTNSRAALGIGSLTFVVDLGAGTFEYIDKIRSYFPIFTTMSSSGRYIASFPIGPIVYDTTTDALVLIRPSYEDWQTSWGGEVRFDNSEQWLLIFESTSDANSGTEKVGISRIDGSERRDLTTTRSHPETMYNWLPPRVDPADLPSAISEPLDPQPIKELHGLAWARLVSWSPDGTQIAALSTGRHEYDMIPEPALTIWDVETGEMIEQRILTSTAAGIEWIETSTGGYEAEIGSNGNSPTDCYSQLDAVPVLDVPSLRIDPVSLSEFYVQALSPDGRWCMTGAAGGSMYPNAILWDTTTWKQVVTLPISTMALAFSPDSTRIAVAASWDVQIWDVADLVAWEK